MTPGRIRLLPEALLSVPVFVVSLLWTFIVQLAEGAGAGDGVGSIILRFSLLFALQVLMFLFPYLTWRVLCPHLSSGLWIWLLVVSVIVGAAVRGVALGLLLFLLGVTDSPNLIYRIAASLGHLAVLTFILWYLVSEVRGLHARRRQLLSDRDQLLELQTVAQRNLLRLGDRATAEIQRAILESLGGLRSTDSSELRERLRLTIDDVVRPLSHQFAAQPPVWTPRQADLETTKVDWPLAAREGLDPRLILNTPMGSEIVVS